MDGTEKQCDCVDLCEWSCENAAICKSLFMKTYSEGEVNGGSSHNPLHACESKDEG